MKVYRVVMNYFNGGCVHGRYESPLFSNADAARDFLLKLCAVPPGDARYWWTETWTYDDDASGPERNALIEVLEVLDEAPEPDRAEEYLTITHG